MNRKNFLSSVIPLAATLHATAAGKNMPVPATYAEGAISVPRYLQPGDTIGITCPSGYMTPEDVLPAVEKMKEWGYQVRLGATVGTRDFTFAGSDEQRAADFQAMIDDDTISAVMLGRGGYGAVRIIDVIDFSKFARRPKWIIGFSDATVFHAHLSRNYGIASIHSKMCNSFPADWSLAEPKQMESIESIRKCLTGSKMEYTAPPNSNNRPGSAEGVLIGGNLSILQNMAATASDINTDGKILFIEEVEEYLYSIDRMLWNLKRSGKLSKLKALVLGGFNRIKADDAGEDFGKTLYAIVLEKVKEYSYPVCFEFPVGHQKENYAVKCGMKHALMVSGDAVTLKEV
jgi:muramoyltetrapeptide carboxypeptidase